MKKLAALALALIIFNCQDDLDGNLTNFENQSISEDVLSRLESLGYNTTDIPVYKLKNEYVVEGDMVFTDADLAVSPAQKQRQTKELIACDNRLNIRVKNDLSGAHSKALVTAVDNWNKNSNSLISMTIVKKNPTITVRFATKADGIKPETSATASGPKKGKAGALIRVNKGRLGSAPWAKVLTHELGHTIGFTHTNSNSGSFIVGSLRTDAASIMNSGGSAGCCISKGDKAALDILYGNCTKGNR